VLQALWHTRAFRALLLSLEASLLRGRVLPALQRTMALMSGSTRAAVSPTAVHSALPPPFNGYEQQDSSELWRCLLSAVEDSLAGTSYARAVQDVFGGRLRATVRCAVCNAASAVEEPVTDLMLSLGTRQRFPCLLRLVAFLFFRLLLSVL
jgi:hypothetical protein